MTALGGKEADLGAGARDQRLWAICELSKVLTTPARLEATFAQALGLLKAHLDLRHGLVALVDGEGLPELVVGADWTEAGAADALARLPAEPVAEAVRTRAPVVLEAVQGDPRFLGLPGRRWLPETEVAFLCVPVEDHGAVIGTLSVERERHRPVPLDEDLRLLTVIANLLGQAVRLQRLIARDRERLIEEQARMDKLLAHSGAAPQPEQAGIVGESPAIKAVLEKLRMVARSNTTVLLRGESGTGKELFAQALHRLSPRKDAPFVAVNCAALPETVLESELFGHEKGAFTNAGAMRRGRFELADGGTLFLDEIGDISPAFQAKLLRVLQEGELERVGGTSTIKVDVRLVAATNRDLEDAVARGQFRADLYYRISVVGIFLPPLRARKVDIPPLAQEFLRRFNEEHGTRLSFEEGALQVLTACAFPGNVRELGNCVRRTATFARSERLGAGDFACSQSECLSKVLWKQPGPEGLVPPPPVASTPSPLPGPAAPAAEKGERERLVEAMEAAGWVQARAARLLGLTPRQVGYALRKHGVEVKKF